MSRSIRDGQTQTSEIINYDAETQTVTYRNAQVSFAECVYSRHLDIDYF